MSRRKPTLTLALALVAALAVVVAGCRGGKGERVATGGAGGGRQLQPGPGFDGSTITLGAITPRTGPAAVIGNPLTAGNQVYVDALNARGGVGGKYKIRLEIVDSQYQPAVALQAYNGMKGDVVLFAQVFGTPITKALLPQLTTDRVVASPASLDAFWVREPSLLPLGSPYQIQSINAVDYYLHEGGGRGRRICGLYTDDPYGQAGFSGLQFAAKEMAFPLVASATFKQGDADFTAQLSRLRGAGCEAVLLTALPTETAKILAGAAQQQYAPRWLAQSSTWAPALATSPLKSYMARHVWLVSEGPTWGDESVPGMRQMLADVRRFKPHQKPDIYFTFGYSQAWAVDQVLEKAVANRDLSRDGILRAMADVGTLRFGGLTGDYRYGPASDRDPPRISTIFKIDPSVPGGLAALKTNFSSEAARRFNFNG